MASSLSALLQTFNSYLTSSPVFQPGYWTYLLLALLVAVEGPFATLLGAAAASAGWMRPGLVFITAAAGNLTADLLWYTLGYAGKLEWALRFGRKLGLQIETLQRLEQGIQENASKILFVAKLTASFMIPSLIAAGLVKARLRRWFPALVAGEMIWTGSLVLIGYYATETIQRVKQGLEFLILGLSLVFLLFILWMGRHLLQKRLNSGRTGHGLST